MSMQAVASMRSRGSLVNRQTMRVMMKTMITVVLITVVVTGRKIIESRQMMDHPGSQIVRVRLVTLVPVNDRLTS